MSRTAAAARWRLRRTWPMAAFFACLLLACQSASAPVPDTTVSDEKMARILADLNIAEAATARLNGYPKDSLKQVYFKQVMDMHSMTVSAYESNLRIISAEPKRMEELMKASEMLLEDKADQ